MDIAKALALSARGMDVQTARLRIIAENLANQDTTGATPGAEPYRRKLITFENRMDQALGTETVRVQWHRAGPGGPAAALRPVAPGGGRGGLCPDAERQQLHRGHGHAGGAAQPTAPT